MFTLDRCDRCDDGVYIMRIAALDDPRGFIDKPFIHSCVKGDRVEAAKALIDPECRQCGWPESHHDADRDDTHEFDPEP